MPPPFPHPLGGFFVQGKTALGVRNADLPMMVGPIRDLVLAGLKNVRDEPLFRDHFKQLGAGIGPENPDDTCV